MASIGSTTYVTTSDSNLLIGFSGTFTKEHESDLSDGAQDDTIYVGSLTANRELRASSNPSVDQITLTPVYLLDDWAASTAYSLGDTVIPTSPNGKRYTVTVAGTSDSSEPTWPTTLEDTVTDGTVTWTCTADDRPTSEITLALSEAELDTNTPGDPLDIGTAISSGSANAVEVWVRLTNTITTVSSTIGTPEIGVRINATREYAV